MEKKKATDE